MGESAAARRAVRSGVVEWLWLAAIGLFTCFLVVVLGVVLPVADVERAGPACGGGGASGGVVRAELELSARAC